MSETIDLLKDLIGYDGSNQSVADDTIDFCQKWLESAGLEVEALSNGGYKMLVCTVGEGDKRLIWNGHVDVVTGHPEQFQAVEQNGKIYGRGAIDMKGGLSAMMVALSELQDEDLEDTSVQLQIVSDEEVGGNYCTAYLVNHGYLGDFAICGEPTQLSIGYKAKGVLQAKLTFTGHSAHGSRPWEGENAILKAFQAYEAIKELPFAKVSSDVYDNPSINLAKLEGGDAYNMVPQLCEMVLDIRYLPEQHKDVILREIKSVTDAKIDIQNEAIPVDNDLDNPYIQLLVSSIEQTTGKADVDIFGQHGTSDGAYYLLHDVPAIEFGPKGANWHGEDEYADIESIETYKEILKDFAKRFSKPQ